VLRSHAAVRYVADQADASNASKAHPAFRGKAKAGTSTKKARG
jgi:hypothetical protein